MTLRQWYAGLAMQGLLACDEYERGLVPEIAYKLADAMIAEGKKQP